MQISDLSKKGNLSKYKTLIKNKIEFFAGINTTFLLPFRP
jgi:hypothetical protein